MIIHQITADNVQAAIRIFRVITGCQGVVTQRKVGERWILEGEGVGAVVRLSKKVMDRKIKISFNDGGVWLGKNKVGSWGAGYWMEVFGAHGKASTLDGMKAWCRREIYDWLKRAGVAEQ